MHKHTIHNWKCLKQIRKDIRNNATPAEATLWNQLKNRKLLGKKFRRQHSIENYIVDFYCPEEQLIIELDSFTANDREQYNRHTQKQKRLSAYGFTVINFRSKDVFENMENVLIQIAGNFSTVNMIMDTKVQ